MSIAGEILVFGERGQLWIRITTNAPEPRLRSRLREKGIMCWVNDIRAFHADRALGGNGYWLLLSDSIDRKELDKALHWL